MNRSDTHDARALQLSGTAVAALVLVSVAGLAMFLWPLILSPSEGQDHSANAPFLLFALLPGLLAVGLSQAAAGGLDAKAVAMLGVLSAVGAALRPLGAGVAGIEVVFFLLILAGRVFGAGFGFLLGSTTLFASALLTGGVGPWLPFQMLASSWVGAGAGLLPRRARGGREIALLVAYGVVAAYLYGFLMNMWFWPFAIGNETSVSFVAGDPVLENLHRFVVFTLLTSTWGWDTGRAITNAMAIVAVGPSVLVVLRRTARRAAFGAAIALEDRPDITSGAAGRRVGAEQHPVRE